MSTLGFNSLQRVPQFDIGTLHGFDFLHHGVKQPFNISCPCVALPWQGKTPWPVQWGLWSCRTLHQSHNRHHNGTDHGFITGDTALFIDSVAADNAREADNEGFIQGYIGDNKHDPVDSACSWSPPAASSICSGKIPQSQQRRPSHKVVFKHFWVNKDYVTGGMQITRAFTTPLIATMGNGTLPDPRNISNVMRASFDMTEWASVVEDVGAHPIGG
ncbi:hypothetical protein ABBQ32_008849 [Trebouxia sp. C0010 RCD-2024]